MGSQIEALLKKTNFKAEIVPHAGQDGHHSKDAAEALGVPVERVIKCLVFDSERGDLVAAVIPGHMQADIDRLTALSGIRLTGLAQEPTVRKFTGFPPGGIPIVALTGRCQVYCDQRLLSYDWVIGAAGASDMGMRFHPGELAKLGLPFVDIAIHSSRSNLSRSTCFRALEERGFVYQVTDPDNLTQQLDSKKVRFYCGFDPTAPSLHVGHLLPIMAMRALQRMGHSPIGLVGSATARIGDPAGRDLERPMLEAASIDSNATVIRQQLQSLLIGEDSTECLVADNWEWLFGWNMIDYLREIGKHFSVAEMMAKDAVKNRLAREHGLSYTEFSYQVLQAMDFLYLNEHYNCRLQIGGSDQWGNIVQGTDLIRRLRHEVAYGITLPLLQSSTGKKMGKTSTGTVWLHPDLFSPYDYYQYWINVSDADVHRFLRLFTEMETSALRDLDQLRGKALREAKRILAFEATKIVHGEEDANRARQRSDALFRKSKVALAQDTGTAYRVRDSDLEKGLTLVELLKLVNITASKAAARRLISQGGIYVGDRRVDRDFTVTASFFKKGSAIIRLGKKRIYQIELVQ